MSKHEIRLVTEWGNGTEKNWLECFTDGCGWKIRTDDETHAGAQRAAREHRELISTRQAKQENDERFMLERDGARLECDRLRLELSQIESGAHIAVNAGVAYSQELHKTRRERDRLRTDLDWMLSEFGHEHWQNCDLSEDECYRCAGYNDIKCQREADDADET